MYFGHSHYLPLTPSSALNPVNFPTQVLFFIVAKNTPTPIALLVCARVRSHLPEHGQPPSSHISEEK